MLGEYVRPRPNPYIVSSTNHPTVLSYCQRCKIDRKLKVLVNSIVLRIGVHTTALRFEVWVIVQGVTKTWGRGGEWGWALSLVVNQSRHHHQLFASDP